MHTMGERKQRQHEECAAAHHLRQRQRWAAVRPGQGEGEGRGAGATRGASVRTYGLRGQRSLPWGRLQCRKSTLGGARAPCPPALPAWRLHVRAAPWRRLSHAGGRAPAAGEKRARAARLLSRKVGREAARTYHAAPQVATPTPLPSPAHSHFHPPAMSAARARGCRGFRRNRHECSTASPRRSGGRRGCCGRAGRQRRQRRDEGARHRGGEPHGSSWVRGRARSRATAKCPSPITQPAGIGNLSSRFGDDTRVNGYLFAARGKPGRFKCPRQARTPDRGKRRGAQPEQAAISLPWRAQSALRRGAWRGRAGRRGRHNETHRDKSR